jgi:orotate phosphoribosyltransferase
MSEITELIKDVGAVKKGKFKLSDGSLTDYYIDKYVFETEPEVLDVIADEIADRLDENDIDVIAGPELGAVPLVTAVSLKTGIPGSFIRTGQKHYGTQARVEGTIEKGDRVAIVEDVTTTGGTILQTASVVEEIGGIVHRMIVIVDRNAEAVENISDEGYELEYLARVGEDLDIENI